MKYRTIFCCLLAIAAAPALAQDTDFVVEDEAMLCAGCHGEDGVPMESDDPVPIIWGQEYFYVLTQLRDYGAGRREHDVMTGIAAQYSRDEAGKLAEYFVAKEWPYIQGEAQDGDQAIAERAATGGQCAACHGRWQGNSNVPRLAGQDAAYLEKTMLDFKYERRLNAPDKIGTMQKLEDDEIAAMARYLSSVQLRAGQ